MKTKIYLIKVLMIFCLENVLSQSSLPYIPTILPPSPNAATLVKFTDVPVSPYTGTADVSVPIYTIEAKGLSIPITLNCHTGGIRMKEESGWVGLGWALSAGGAISRVIMDHDDFNTDVPYFTNNVPQVQGDMSTTQYAQASNQSIFSQYFFDMFCTYKVNFTGGTADYYKAFSQGPNFYDIEPDIFTYNFAGHSGKFIILRNRQIVLQKQDNVVIQVDNAGSSFNITDESGNKFIFQDRDSSGSATGLGSTFATSTWYLSKIKTQQNDSVTFTYSSDNSWTYIAPEIYESYNTFCSDNQGYFRGNPAGTFYLNKTLQTIDFSNGQLQFVFDGNRSDLPGGKKLNAIKIYSKSGSLLNYVKENDFYYSYFDPPGDINPADSLELKRLKLDSVKQLSGGSAIPPYSFLYNMPPIAGPPVSAYLKHGYSIDHWGFFNGISNSTYIPKGTYLYSPPGPSQPGPGLYYTYNGAYREPDPTAFYTSVFSLKQMTFPTGGKTAFTYAQNDYDDQKSRTQSSIDFPQYTFHLVDTIFNIHTQGISSGPLDLSGIVPILPAGSPTRNITIDVFFRGTGNNTVDYHFLHSGLIYFTFTAPGFTYTVDVSEGDLQGGAGQWSKSMQLTIPGAPANCTWTGYVDPSVSDTYFADMNVSISFQEYLTTYNKNPTLTASGLRVNTIVDYSADNTIAKKRVFNYGYLQDKLGTGTPQYYTYGKIMSYPSYARYTSNSTSVGYCTSLTFFGSSYNSLTSVIAGNIVGYDQVTETTVDPITGQDIGKTIYNYFNSPDTGVSYGGFRLPGTLNIGNNLNGLLVSTALFSDVNGIYNPVSKSVNYYHTANRSIYYSTKYLYPPGNPNSFGGGGVLCSGDTSTGKETYNCFYPSIKSERILLDSTYETLYDQMDTTKFIQTKKYFFYDNPKHYQVTRTKQKDSKGNIIINNTKFPQDYIPTGNTFSGNTIIDSMIKRNLLSSEIENWDSLYFAGSSTGFITSAKLNTYKILSSGSIDKDKLFYLNIASPVANFTPYTVNNNVVSQDSRYRQMISFDSYDNLNNITQYTATDQVPNSFLWDYSKVYPIAQVKNAVNSDIAFSSFEADGTGNWTMTNGGGSTSQVSVNVAAAGSNYNLFPTQTPTSVTQNDHHNPAGMEFGIKFTSATAGSIKGIRFYKTSGNTGTHIGELYSSTGVRLAQATFTGETTTGWQTVLFSSPVLITANTTYTAAYYSSLGNYVEDVYYFLHNSVTNGPLNAAADGTDGIIGADPGNGQGTFLYSSSAAFPNQLYQAANYWVDAIFTPGTTPYSNAGVNQTITLPISSVVLNGSASTGTISSYSWTKISGPNSPSLASPNSAFTSVSGLIQGVYVFQLSLNSGASIAQVTVTVQAVGTPINIFTTQAVPSVTLNDGSSLELGVKFRSSVSGQITGIKFYKTSTNIGTHIGELYAYPSGTRLAQATFSGETGSGWQTVSFSSPVTISANTTYVAAYWSSSGKYSSSSNHFAIPITNGPLTALADGTDGHNGIYLYSGTPAYPTTYTLMSDEPNYWIDVMFLPDNTPMPNAGNNIAVTLPVSSITLSGSNSLGTVSNYMWTKVSGPNNPTIVSPNNLVTNVTGLVAGTYVFQLAVNGASNGVYALTGTKSYNLAGNTITKTGLISGKKYILSYWSRGSASSVSGATSVLTTGRSTNGWTYYQHAITMSSTTLTITGSSFIDELRLYPLGAQMTSLTYKTLVGTSSINDLNSEITFYEYDSLQRIRNIKDYQGNIVKNFQYNYAPTSVYTVVGNYSVSMQTFAGSNTLSYPVGVFDLNYKLIGNAANQAQYITLWMSDTTNSHTGSLSAGSDSMHFQFALYNGRTLPTAVLGMRYYQYDLAYNVIDAVGQRNAEYIDFGDGISIYMGKFWGDTAVKTSMPLNTTFLPLSVTDSTFYNGKIIHTYPDTTLKTLTFYHNDAFEDMDLWPHVDSSFMGLTKIKNLKGYCPQGTYYLTPNSLQQKSALSIDSIKNWNTINSLLEFGLYASNGGKTTCANIGYTQDFMKNNMGLYAISTATWPGEVGYYDSTFKISRLKTNWNTYFTQLTVLEICDEHWNREDLSGLLNLQFFYLIRGNQTHSGLNGGSPATPIPSPIIDSVINQIARGSGQTKSNGYIVIYTGGPTRTSLSDPAYNFLLSKSWTIDIETN